MTDLTLETLCAELAQLRDWLDGLNAKLGGLEARLADLDAKVAPMRAQLGGLPLINRSLTVLQQETRAFVDAVVDRVAAISDRGYRVVRLRHIT